MASRSSGLERGRGGATSNPLLATETATATTQRKTSSACAKGAAKATRGPCVGRRASADGLSHRGAELRMSDAPAHGASAPGAASGRGLARETPASKGKGMIVRRAVCAPDAEGQPPMPAADPFSFRIKRFAWEEGEAARKEDWSAARCAAIKQVILQRPAPASSRVGLCERQGGEARQAHGRSAPVGLLARRAPARARARLPDEVRTFRSRPELSPPALVPTGSGASEVGARGVAEQVLSGARNRLNNCLTERVLQHLGAMQSLKLADAAA